MIFARFLPPHVRTNYRWDARSGWLTGLFMGMTLPFLGVMARRLGASPLDISLLVAIPFLGHLLSMLVAWGMQNRPKKPFHYWLGMCARGVLLLMAVATSSTLFIIIAVASLFIGFFTTPAYAAIIREAYPENKRATLMGTVRIGVTMAMMLGGLYAGRLLDHGLSLWWVTGFFALLAVLIVHETPGRTGKIIAGCGIPFLGVLGAPLLAEPVSYRVVFPVAAVCGMLAIWMFNHLPESTPDAPNPARRFSLLEGVGTLFTDRRFGLYCLAFFIMGFGNLLQGPLIPLFQVDELGISDQWVGMLATITAGVSAVCYLIWGRLIDRRGPFEPLLLSAVCLGFAPLIYAVSQRVETLILAAVVIGIVNAGIDLTWVNAVMRFADRDNVPRYAALHTFLVGVRGLTAPFVGAWLLTHLPIRHCFFISMIIIWLGALAFILVLHFVLRPAMHDGMTARCVASKAS